MRQNPDARSRTPFRAAAASVKPTRRMALRVGWLTVLALAGAAAFAASSWTAWISGGTPARARLWPTALGWRSDHDAAPVADRVSHSEDGSRRARGGRAHARDPGMLATRTPVRVDDRGLIETLTRVVPTGARLSAGPLPLPADFYRPVRSLPAGVSVKDFGAKGDGIADDTAAIQAALDDQRRNPDGTPNQPSPQDYNGRPRVVYLPPGTYKVSGTLRWVGCCLGFRGAGAGATTLKLADGAAGFGSKTAPKAVVETEQGNESFRQMVTDLVIDTGRGNPGAIGVNFVSSNNGALRNVLIRSSDGQGYAGIGMERSWTGPALVRDVEVIGFDHGVRVGPGEYGVTFEGLTLRNQRVAGILNRYGALAIRNLLSANQVPAFVGSEVQNNLALIDADLRGGLSTATAIATQGEATLLNVVASGYARAFSRRGVDVPGTTLVDYATTHQRALSGGNRSLGLPVRETPLPPQTPPASWFRFPDGADYGNLRKLQQYLDTNPETVYFPFDVYFSYNEVAVNVPASVKRIIGFSSVINSDARGVNGGGLRLIVAQDSPEPLIVEEFGYGVKIDHRGPRTVAVKHGNYDYTSSAGAGDVYFEDVTLNPQTFLSPRNVWARQLNIETIGSRIVKLDNRAAQVWILGFKTEGGGAIFNTSGTGATELLGGFMLPNVAENEYPAFHCNGGRMALTYRYEAYGSGGVNRKHAVQWRETRNGRMLDLRTDLDLPRNVGRISCGN